MSRCPNCNKFSALEFQDPEEESFDDELTLDQEDGTVSGTVSMSVRIVRTLECCGDDAKEATVEAEEEISLSLDQVASHVERDDGPEGGKWRWKDGCGVVVEHDDPQQVEEGGGRYAKSYFGAYIDFRVSCACGAHFEDGHLTDKVAASSMDDCL